MKKMLITSFAILLFLGACSSKESTEPKTEISTEEVQVKKSEQTNEEVYFKDGIAKLNDITIKITETKVIVPGEKGNEYSDEPVFAIWYDTTNHSDKTIDSTTAWIAIFEAVQDNNKNSVNRLEVAATPDEKFLDSQFEIIKKDGTIQGAIAYTLDDLETPVTLIANQGIAGQELGKEEYKIK